MKAYEIAGRPAIVDPAVVLADLATSLERRNLVFFSGAGLSREYPSLAPLVVEKEGGLPGINKLLVNMLVEACPAFEEPITKSVEGKALEYLLGSISEIAGPATFEILKIFESQQLGARPNYRHYALALIAKAGFCSMLFTMNFDDFLEKAMRELGVPGITIPEMAPTRVEEARLYARALHAPAPGSVYLFKLHGSVGSPRSFLTTVEALGFGLPRHKEALLTSALTANSCFFMGYRAGDLDVFPLLQAIPRDRQIFWYERPGAETQLDAPGFRALRLLLAGRRHAVLIGDLSEILRDILKRIEVEDAPALVGSGISALSDAGNLERAAVADRTAAILDFSRGFASRVLPGSTARLIASTLIRLDIPHGTEIRDRLFASIDAATLSPEAKLQYLGQLAEREWNHGHLSEAIRVRADAIAESRRRRDTDPRHRREQRIRIGRDYLALFRRNSDYRLLASALGHLYLAFSETLLYRGSASEIAEGRFRVMLLSQVARAFHARTETHLGTLLALRLGGARDLLAERQAERNLKRNAAIAECLYRRCLRYRDYGFGWISLCTRNLSESIMHRRGSCPAEAKALIADARRPLLWQEQLADPEAELGPHEGLRLYYDGAVAEALARLNDTLEYYGRTGHLSGKVKTLLFKALCHQGLGEHAEARECLQLRTDLMRKYK